VVFGEGKDPTGLDCPGPSRMPGLVLLPHVWS